LAQVPDFRRVEDRQHADARWGTRQSTHIYGGSLSDPIVSDVSARCPGRACRAAVRRTDSAGATFADRLARRRERPGGPLLRALAERRQAAEGAHAPAAV